MDEMSPVTATLAAVSLLLSAYLLLHRLLIALGVRKLQHGFSGGPEEITTSWQLNIDDDLVGQMTALGFSPVGLYWEKMTLSRTFWELVFVSKAEKSFGILYPNKQIMPRRASFITVCPNGSVVYTKNYQGGVEGEKPTFIAGPPARVEKKEADPEAGSPLLPLVVNLLLLGAGGYLVYDSVESSTFPWLGIGFVALAISCLWGGRTTGGRPAEEPTEDLDARFPLDQTLHAHRLRVQKMAMLDPGLSIGDPQEDFLEALRKYHAHPFVSWRHRSADLTNLAAIAFFLFVVPVALGVYFGWTHPAPWACLLAEGMVGLWMRHGLSSSQVIGLLRSISGDRPKAEGGARTLP